MSWKDQLRPALFRGKAFKVPGHTAQAGGRRVAVHEFPGRDIPFVEDLGRRTSEYEIEAYIVGDDYIARRDELIDACSQAGSGELVHPYVGTRTVFCTDCRFTERLDEGRMVRFTLKFVVAGENRFPITVSDRTSATSVAAATLQSAAEASFAESFSVASLPAFVSTAAENTVVAALTALPDLSDNVAATALASDLIGDLPALILEPATLASQFSSLAASAYGTTASLETLTAAAQFGTGLSAVPTTTATRVRQKANQDCFVSLVSRTFTAIAARTAVATIYSDRSALETAKGSIQTMMEDAILAASDSGETEVFSGLRALRAQVLKELGSRAPTLARIITLEPVATEPSLITAYRHYGSAGRAEEIRVRNNLRHPGFVPGGHRIEVLSNV